MKQEKLKELQDQLTEAVETFAPELELVFKAMFGGECAYAKGRAFATLSHAGLALKLSPDVQEELLKLKGAERLQYYPEGPISKLYVVVPPRMRSRPGEFAKWADQSLDFVMAQPASKPRRKKAA